MKDVMKQRGVLVLFLLPVILLSVGMAHGTVVGLGPNVDIAGESSPDRQRVEPTIAVDPRSPSIIVAGAQDLTLKAVGEHRWHGYYRSTDNGLTWSSGLLPGFPGDISPQGLASPLHRSNATSDPVLAFDRNGNLYYAGLALNVTSAGFVTNTALFVAKFTNDGAIYSGTTLISAGVFPDKPWIAVDTTGGPNDGNVYVAYDANRTATEFFATLFTRSIDGGMTFSAPFYAPADETGELPGMAVDTTGNVYVSDVAFNPVTGAFLGYVEVTKITNGGTSIAGTTRPVNPAFPIPSPLPGGSFRAFTIPQMAADQNGVYLVLDDFRTGNANVLFTRSTNGGATWSFPLTINDVVAGQHFFPAIASSGGIISVVWYDSRFSTAPTMTSLDVFYAQSINAGVSFSSNLRVTSVSFDPNIVRRTDSPGAFQPFIGDYIQVASSPTAVHPVWADNRNACDTFDPAFGCVDQDAFTASITVSLTPDFTLTGSPTSLTVPQESSSKSTITLTSQNGFAGTVTLSLSVVPIVNQGPSAILTSTTVILSAGGSASITLTVSAKGSTPTGSYTVRIIASSGALSHTISVPISVVLETHGT